MQVKKVVRVTESLHRANEAPWSLVEDDASAKRVLE